MSATQFKLLLIALGAAIVATVRRLFRGRQLPSWSFGLEVVVHIQRKVVEYIATLDPVTVGKLSESGGLPPSEFVKQARAEKVDAPVPGEWIFAPSADAPGVMLFLHGGGYAMGSVESHRDMISRLALATGMRIFAANYRLAPIHPYPAAVDDAQTAYQWMLDSGIDARRIVVCGDSAGGGLTAALIQRLRAESAPLPGAAILISPWLDLTCSSDSHQRNAATDYLPIKALKMWAGQYAGETSLDDPIVSPHFGDPTGFPPTMVLAGTAEILYDEGIEFAHRAEKAGVVTEIHTGHEMPHDWPLLAGVTPLGQESIVEMAGFVHRHIAAD